MKKLSLAMLVPSSLLFAEIITHTELGYINTSGNTNSQVFTVDAKAKKEIEKHIFTTLLQGKYSEEEDIETANNWLGEFQYDFKFSKLFSANYLYGYKMDKFSSYEYQAYTGPGIKYLAINDSKVHNLNFTLSYLYSQDKTIDTYEDGSGNVVAYPYVDANANPIAKTKTASGNTNDYQSTRLSMEYKWNILKNLKLGQDATYRQSLDESDEYFIYSKTTLSTKIADNLSAGFSYKIDYTNTVAEDIENTDKTFTANLIIDY
jgi:putative salt-induced outer membrane protein